MRRATGRSSVRRSVTIRNGMAPTQAAVPRWCALVSSSSHARCCIWAAAWLSETSAAVRPRASESNSTRIARCWSACPRASAKTSNAHRAADACASSGPAETASRTLTPALPTRMAAARRNESTRAAAMETAAMRSPRRDAASAGAGEPAGRATTRTNRTPPTSSDSSARMIACSRTESRSKSFSSQIKQR